MDDGKMISLVKKNPFQTLKQDKNTLGKIGVSLSMSTNKTPSIMNNRRNRLDFAGKTSKNASQVLESEDTLER